MLNKKVRLIITAALSAALILSGCGSSAAELVDETISESTVLQTSAETTTTTATTPETTTATTTAATTTTTMTETTTKATTAATTETTVAPTTTVTTTPTTTETTTNATTETTTVTTTETTTEDITADLTPEELEIYNSMPDIVFVFSHRYWSSSSFWDKYSNIRGFYITKDGKIKMYAFSDEEESKYTDVVEVYDELENVTCSEMTFHMEDNEITQDDLDKVAISDLIELYNRLLFVDEKAYIEKQENHGDSTPEDYMIYGVRLNKYGKKEFILLSGWGLTFYTNTDTCAQEIYTDIEHYFHDCY